MLTEKRPVIPFETAENRSDCGFYIELGTDPWQAIYPPGDTPKPTACARLTYGPEILFMHLRSFRPADELIIRRERFGDPVCRDSCLEFFFYLVSGCIP